MTERDDESLGNPPRAERWLWLVAVGVGGMAGIFHLLGRQPESLGNDYLGSAPVIVGQVGLYASPLLLGILSGLFFKARPVLRSLGLSTVCLLIAAPMLGEGLICFVLILPVHLVISPLSAYITTVIASKRKLHLPGATSVELLLLLLPFGAALYNRLSPPGGIEPVTMVDSVIAHAPRAAVWKSIDHLQFKFTDTAPLLVRMGLPVPREIQGGGAFVGAERRVLFSNGTVLAKVVGANAPERLDLQLSVEHAGREFFDHWSVLGASHFLLEDLPGGRTRITHSTTYQPLGFPRWYFEPVERHLGRRVQRYMIETYARQSFSPAERVAER